MTITIPPKQSSSRAATSHDKPQKSKRPVTKYDPSDPDTPPDLLIAEFGIVVDSREQAPYRFTGIIDDKSCQQIIIRLEHRGLKSGDYSIVGLEDQITIERKSLTDFYQSISSDRERFEREISRIHETYRYGLVVIEGDYEDIANPESFTQVLPKTAFRTIQSWEIRYPTVHWKWLPNRRIAEVWTYRQLEMFWRIWKHEQEYLKKLEQEKEMEPQLVGDILQGLSSLKGLVIK